MCVGNKCLKYCKNVTSQRLELNVHPCNMRSKRVKCQNFRVNESFAYDPSKANFDGLTRSPVGIGYTGLKVWVIYRSKAFGLSEIFGIVARENHSEKYAKSWWLLGEGVRTGLQCRIGRNSKNCGRVVPVLY